MTIDAVWVRSESSALNSTIRRFAGGIGGQVATILLASYPVINAGHPRFSAFTLVFVISAGLCAAGAVLIGAPGRTGRNER